VAGSAIGTAGWSIPPRLADAFAGEGTHLERYARIMAVTEINSSFHRPHRRATYERWAASTPPEFRFAAKLPKAITHECRLVAAEAKIDGFIEQVAGLGDKLGILLVQLPPSLAFDPAFASGFFMELKSRASRGCEVVCEPRHASWFTPEAEQLLASVRVARVAADPALAAGADQPGGWRGLRYHRLHGSPRVYYSAYKPRQLRALADDIAAEQDAGVKSWCIFDNTASGAALADALQFQQLLAVGM
jgi:uncharacterized protein YecE (DUF72 family)